MLRSALNWSDYVRSMALEVTIDHTVLAFTLGISIFAAILFGLAPALHGTALDLHSTKVTDTGLKELVGFKSLQYLDLRDAQVTDVGVRVVEPVQQFIGVDQLRSRADGQDGDE